MKKRARAKRVNAGDKISQARVGIVILEIELLPSELECPRLVHQSRGGGPRRFLEAHRE